MKNVCSFMVRKNEWKVSELVQVTERCGGVWSAAKYQQEEQVQLPSDYQGLCLLILLLHKVSEGGVGQRLRDIFFFM